MSEDAFEKWLKPYWASEESDHADLPTMLEVAFKAGYRAGLGAAIEAVSAEMIEFPDRLTESWHNNTVSDCVQAIRRRIEEHTP